MNDPNPVRPRNRLKLVLVASVFLLPAIIAVGLGMSGWQPGTRSHGEPIVPQRSFADVRIALPDGSHWAWRDSEPRMTLIALPGSDCAANCLRVLKLMTHARIVLNRHAERLRLLYVGQPPADPAASAMRPAWRFGRDVDGKLAAFRPQGADSVAAILVESNGTALVRYRAGFDPNGLRVDLQKVVK